MENSKTLGDLFELVMWVNKSTDHEVIFNISGHIETFSLYLWDSEHEEITHWITIMDNYKSLKATTKAYHELYTICMPDLLSSLAKELKESGVN